MKARLIKSTRQALQREYRLLVRKLAILADLRDREDTMRERLKQIQFLLGGEEQR